MTIKYLQQWVDEDWKSHNDEMPSVTLQLLYVMEELGEVAEAIRKSESTSDRLAKVTKPVDLGSELGDLLIAIATLANHYQVDLTAEIERFQKRIEDRRDKV